MSNLLMEMPQRHADCTTTTTTTTSTTADDDKTSSNIDDLFHNTLCLKLKKPKHWKWELTTSRSSCNIALPRVMLYDHKGALLADANTQEEQIIKQQATVESHATALRQQSKNTSEANKTTTPAICSATATNGRISSSGSSERKLKTRSDTAMSMNSGKQVVHFASKAADKSHQQSCVGLPTPSTTTTTPTTTTPSTRSSSTSAPRQKRRYRRSKSTKAEERIGGDRPAGSILERLSLSRGRMSSPECGEECESRPSRCFLRTSKAGTLVVQQHSFSRYRRRRQQRRHSSTATMLSKETQLRTGGGAVINAAKSQSTVSSLMRNSERHRSEQTSLSRGSDKAICCVSPAADCDIVDEKVQQKFGYFKGNGKNSFNTEDMPTAR